MNIAEAYKKRQDEKEKKEEIERLKRVEDLPETIITKMSNPKVIHALENYLLEFGYAELKDFGCLCQKGFCTWQKGIEYALDGLIREWADKGVQVRLSLGLQFNAGGNPRSIMNDRITIKDVLDWNNQQ